MTTVINYNVLNFITMKLNNITLNNDVRSYNQYLDDRGKARPWEQDEMSDVIDVTPRSRAAGDGPGGEVRAWRAEKRVDFTDSSRTGILYDREGKPLQVFRPKGLLVDTYV